MAQQRFDYLLQAIHNSVLKAQELTEEQHIHQLRKYFDEEGKPIMQKILVPSLDPDHEPEEMVPIQVPLMSLLPPSAIKIKEMKVDFEIGLGKMNTNEIDGLDNKETIQASLAVDLGGSGGLFSKKQSKAKVSITFEGGDPSESFLRINDHLIKSVV